MWGGCTEDYFRKEIAFDGFETFDCYLETWTRKITKGDPPPWLYGGVCASSGHNIYMYGGDDRKSLCGSLHEFNTKTLSWRKLAPHSADGPMKKDDCGMIVWGEKLILFGGCGIPSSPTQPGADFIKLKDTKYSEGRTNEMHVFNLREGKSSTYIVHVWYGWLVYNK